MFKLFRKFDDSINFEDDVSMSPLVNLLKKDNDSSVVDIDETLSILMYQLDRIEAKLDKLLDE
jgi:hypothetical protein|tara:strand:- start:1379 stop:1567 length:189 start_codon:yes stop_codon:yes gene_type:complete